MQSRLLLLECKALPIGQVVNSEPLRGAAALDCPSAVRRLICSAFQGNHMIHSNTRHSYSNRDFGESKPNETGIGSHNRLKGAM
jgi:hypothetical protein